MGLLYIERVKDNRAAFEKKVIQISTLLHAKNPMAFANWLMAIMNAESGLNSKAQNKAYPIQGGFATGLIQFIPSTAGSLVYKNYSSSADSKNNYALGKKATEILYSLSNVEQLDYVYKYFYSMRGKIKSFVDVCLTVFYPAFVGKPDSTIFPTYIRSSNPFLARNRISTIADYKRYILTKLIPQNLKETRPDIYKYFFDAEKSERDSFVKPVLILFGGLWLSLAAYYLLRQ